ncbi:MAG: hypothetical protein Q7S64_01800 [bacterium]|nr:hypothetical protein [bacterium]
MNGLGSSSLLPLLLIWKGELIVGQPGCSSILLLGFIRTKAPVAIRCALQELRQEIANDSYFAGVPSIKRATHYFHAKDDIPEVRERVFRLLHGLDFKAEFIVARKIEKIFVGRHKKQENVFYDDLIVKLFQNKLHVTKENQIYFAVRGNTTRQEFLTNAIQTAILSFEKKWATTIDSVIKVQAQTMTGEPCLQVADYMNWAVQRAFIRGDIRFLDFVRNRISCLVDVYDFANYPHNFYTSKNSFDVNKISPL